MPETAREAEFKVMNVNTRPGGGYLATADVRVGDMLLVRNVKVKGDDYGELVAVMPRTKMPDGSGYKDSIVFDSKEIREQFDKAVIKEYKKIYFGFSDPGEEAAQGERALQDSAYAEGVGNRGDRQDVSEESEEATEGFEDDIPEEEEDIRLMM